MQFSNNNNPALQRLNQRTLNESEVDAVDAGGGLKISSTFAQHIKAVLTISASSTSPSISRTELDSHANMPIFGNHFINAFKIVLTIDIVIVILITMFVVM